MSNDFGYYKKTGYLYTRHKNTLKKRRKNMNKNINIENYLSRGYRFEAINDSSFVPHQKVNN